MKISTKGRYGLRLMISLAQNYQKGLVSLKEIAQHQEISEKYLEQIIILLHKSGLIRSVRGSQGGYALAQSPADITAGMVLRALEGPLVPVDCVLDDEMCSRIDQCPTRGLWEKIADAVNDVVEATSLADLANPPAADDFVI